MAKQQDASNLFSRVAKRVAGSDFELTEEGLDRARDVMDVMGQSNTADRVLDPARKILKAKKAGRNFRKAYRAKKGKRAIRKAHGKGQAI